MRFLPAATKFFVLSATALAAPGGYVVDAISDEFETLSAMWGPGLRGMPEFLVIQVGILSIRSIDDGDDAYPSAEDMTSTYANQLGRSLEAAEGPSVIAWVWLPPFEEWPQGVNAAGFREWMGFRVTAYDESLPSLGGFYFPGIYVATDDDGPCLIARVGDGFGPDVTIGRVTAAGWWTFGLAWNEEGRTEYYAAPGRVTLTNNHLLHTTPTFDQPEANRSMDQLVGNYLALRMTYPPTGQLSPDWRVDAIRVHVKAAPLLPTITPSLQDQAFRLDMAGCARGFRYVLEASVDLLSWTPVGEIISDGQDWIVREPASDHRFYRVALPERSTPGTVEMKR
jgi:hypothetical protein